MWPVGSKVPWDQRSTPGLQSGVLALDRWCGSPINTCMATFLCKAELLWGRADCSLQDPRPTARVLGPCHCSQSSVYPLLTWEDQACTPQASVGEAFGFSKSSVQCASSFSCFHILVTASKPQAPNQKEHLSAEGCFCGA